VAADPLGHVGCDDRLAGRANCEPLVEFVVAALRGPRHLGVEPLDDILLPFEIALGDEHREVGVLHTGRFELAVEFRLDRLPQRVTAWPGDDEAAHPVGAVAGEAGLLHDLGVPLARVVFLALGDPQILLATHCWHSASGTNKLGVLAVEASMWETPAGAVA